MPSRQVHRSATIALAAVSLPAALVCVPACGAGALMLPIGCLAGLAVHPDLDLALRRRTTWALFWRTYAWVATHRGRLSHSLVIGTLVRLAYVALPIMALAVALGAAAAVGQALTWPGTWWFVAGLALADGLHIAMDRIF